MTSRNTTAPTSLISPIPDAGLSESAPPPLLPEALAYLPHDDRGPVIVGSVWLMIGVASIFLGLRLFCKHVGRRALWWDDWILIVSWLLLAVDGALATHLVTYFGFGKHSWDFMPASLDSFIMYFSMRATVAITAIAWTKSAFAVMLLRLSQPWMTWLLWAILISMNIFMMLGALVPWVQCTPLKKSWTPSVPGTCWNPDIALHTFISSSAYSAAMDFVLAVLSWKLIWNLKMKPHEKIGVAVCMSLGVLAGITAIIKTINLPKLASGDIYDAADVLLWDIAEVCITMVVICIPILRTMLGKLSGAGLQSRSNRTNMPCQNATQNDAPSVSMKGILRSMTSDSWQEDVECRLPTVESHRGGLPRSDPVVTYRRSDISQAR